MCHTRKIAYENQIKECIIECMAKATDSSVNQRSQNGRGSKPALDSLVAVRNSSPGRPEPFEGNLVAAAG